MKREKLMEYAVLLAIAEEAARQVKVTVTTPVEPAPAQPTAVRRTIVNKSVDVTIPSTVVDDRGSGKLKEIVFVSDHPYFSVAVSVDGTQLFRESWSWFNSISPVLDEVSAFRDDNGDYVLHLTDISYGSRLTVSVEPAFGLLTPGTKIKTVVYKLEKIL